jgi:hypothetical protein
MVVRRDRLLRCTTRLEVRRSCDCVLLPRWRMCALDFPPVASLWKTFVRWLIALDDTSDGLGDRGPSPLHNPPPHPLLRSEQHACLSFVKHALARSFLISGFERAKKRKPAGLKAVKARQGHAVGGATKVRRPRRTSESSGDNASSSDDEGGVKRTRRKPSPLRSGRSAFTVEEEENEDDDDEQPGDDDDDEDEAEEDEEEEGEREARLLVMNQVWCGVLASATAIVARTLVLFFCYHSIFSRRECSLLPFSQSPMRGPLLQARRSMRGSCPSWARLCTLQVSLSPPSQSFLDCRALWHQERELITDPSLLWVCNRLVEAASFLP